MKLPIALSASLIFLFCTAATESVKAQAEPLAVIDETTGEWCDPCPLHLVGESHLTALPSGVIVSRCEGELSGDAYSDGAGELALSQIGSHSSPDCAITDCTGEPSENHFPVGPSTEDAAGDARITVRVCLGGPTADLHCDLALIPVEGGTHEYAFSGQSVCEGGSRRFEWDWATEGTAVEVAHDGRPVEVVNESDGLPCNPCTMHLIGESHYTSLFSGLPVTWCQDEADVTIYHDGSGELSRLGSQDFGNPSSCFIQNCPADEGHWSIRATEAASGSQQLSVRICLLSAGVPRHCDAAIDLNQQGSHDYWFSIVVVSCPHPSLRFEAQWDDEGSDGIEVIDL